MESQVDKPFKYDAPSRYRCRIFLLDLNEDHEPLSGKLMSFTFTSVATSATGFIKPLIQGFNEDDRRIMKLLTDKDKYIALSYCWGEEDDAKRHPLWVSTISCKLGPSRWNITERERIVMDHEPDRNGYLMIHSNLHDYLLEHRRRGIKQFLWADAICIEQNNLEDKNNQIPLMRYFYEDAGAVHVWLGKATPIEEGALRIMPGMTEKLSQDAEEEMTPNVEELLERLELPPPDQKIWHSLAGIFSRPWWDRLWTLQEVTMGAGFDPATEERDGYKYRAPHVYVLCGNATVSWRHFDNFAAALAKHAMKHWFMSQSLLPTMYQLHGLDAIREVRTCREGLAATGWAVGLSSALVATRRRKASLPQDMVLGMLSMLDHATVKELALNVSMPASEVFVRFAKFYIRNEPRECLLNRVATRERMIGLPSWCPDFSATEETASIGTRWFGHYDESKEHKAQMPHAGFKDDWDWSFPMTSMWMIKGLANPFLGNDPERHLYDSKNPRQISIVPDSDSILASGVALDIVVGVVDCNPAADSPDFLTPHGAHQTLLWDEDCWQLIKEKLSKKISNDVFARTITTNRVSMEVSAASDILYDVEGQIDFAEDYFYFKKYIQTISEDEDSHQVPLYPSAKAFADCLFQMSRRRRFFVTESGRIGLGPSDTRVGDSLVIIFYCPTPYLLRKRNENWHFVGESYVHELMNGEVLDMFDRKEVQETKWVID